MSPYLTHELRIARVQRTLEYFEQDIPLLDLRVKELSQEQQQSAKKFAAAVIDQTRAELQRLLADRPVRNFPVERAGEVSCEAAD